MVEQKRAKVAITHLQGKLLLKPDRLSSLEQFHDFGKQIKRQARSLKVGFVEDPEARRKPRVREIVFGDTKDFRLYKEDFILRRRIRYVDGFAAGEPEIVFKFRCADRARAAALDVRPAIPGKFRVKFKVQILPLHDQIGGYRLLYSHNCQFGISQAPAGNRRTMSYVARAFPVLKTLKKSKTESIEFVNEGIVEELLLPVGQLDFGKGIVANSDIALWRTRGEHMPLIAEYSFQVKLGRGDQLPRKAERLLEEFFIGLQRSLSGWIALGATNFGGGVMAYLRNSVVEKHQWLSDRAFIDLMVISQVVPGLKAVNLATLIGDRLRGTAGALAALLGICLPGALLMYVFGIVYQIERDRPLLDAALAGVAPAAVGLLLATALELGRKSLSHTADVVFVTLTVICVNRLHMSVITALLGVGTLAALWYGVVRPAKTDSHQ